MNENRDYGCCTRCGAALVPGENWYTMKGDHVCCHCSKFPTYATPRQAEPYEFVHEDAEEYILERQDSWFDD